MIHADQIQRNLKIIIEQIEINILPPLQFEENHFLYEHTLLFG